MPPKAAANRPQDLRLQRKAIILAGGFAGGQRDPGRKAELLQLVSSAVVNADNSAASCDARGEIGNLYDAAGELQQGRRDLDPQRPEVPLQTAR